MNTVVLALVSFSALINAYWNFVLKKSINKGADKILLYWLSSFSGVMIYSIIFLLLIIKYDVTYQGIFLAALCGIFFALYTFSLSKSYELSDLSHAYPLTKITPLFTLFIGYFYLRETITISALIGIFLVVFGVYCMHLRDFTIKNFLRPIISIKSKGSLFALATAIISAIYGLIYKASAGLMNPFIFIYASYAFLTIFYAPFLIFKSHNILSEINKFRKEIIQIGLLDIFGASLLLIALSLSQLSYVFSLRQMSILFTVFGGVYFLKEKYEKTRILATILIIFGIFLITVNI